jgi:hypothetical protein
MTAEITLASLSPAARSHLRWGGYVTGDAATDELRAAGLIRYAPEHVHLAGPDVQVLTPEGADAFALLFTQPSATDNGAKVL